MAHTKIITKAINNLHTTIINNKEVVHFPFLFSVDGEEDKILEVYQKGYLLRGKVLRAAKVAVGNGNHK